MIEVIIEKVNMGYWLVDCSECGTVGVWNKREGAKLGKAEHESSHKTGEWK